MVRFEGYVDHEILKHTVWKRYIILTSALGAASCIPGVLVLFIADHLWKLIGVAWCIIFIISTIVLARMQVGDREIYVEITKDTILFAYQTLTLNDIGMVVDYGEYYDVSAFPILDFVLPKKLLVEGTLEEFEEIVDNILVRKYKKSKKNKENESDEKKEKEE